MGTFKFGIKMLKTDIRQTFLYSLFFIFSVATLYNGYNLMDDKNFNTINGTTSLVCQVLLFALTILLLFMVFFANSYFITGKSKEFAIAELNGVWSSKLLGLVCFQTLIFGAIGSILGILLGIITKPIITTVMYNLLGAKQNLNSTSSDSLVITIIIVLFIICPYLIVGDYTYLFKKQVKDLIYGQRQLYTPYAKKFTTPEIESFKKLNPAFFKKKEAKPSKLFSVIFYFMPLTVFFLNAKTFNQIMTFYLLFSVIGIQKLLQNFFPDQILALKKDKFADDEIKLMSLSNLHYSLRKINFLVITLAVSAVFLIYIIGAYKDSYQVKVMGIFVYICAIVSLSISILYKFIIEASYRKHIFKQLQLIGYIKSQIKKIIWQELIILYGITIIVPLFHIMIYLFKFISLGIITIQLSILLISIFVIILLIMIPISYQVYKKLVM